MTEDPKTPGLLRLIWQRRSTIIAIFSLLAILLHLVLRWGLKVPEPLHQNLPLWITLLLGGVPLVAELLQKLLRREFGSDTLGAVSIITSVIMGEYLAGAIIVLMLSGGEALESYALRSASSVLAALARRMPSRAHRKIEAGMEEVSLEDIATGDTLCIYPHETCPVDGVVTDGRGTMDESYLTGEPFQITKTTGSNVISGAINGESVLTIRATRPAADSRYARIMQVMRDSEQSRPHMRRLGDRLGAIYTPVAITVALLAWWFSGEAVRFLAVLVIATPCPLLLGIPIAIIGSISLCARRGIIVKDPVALEQISRCQVAIFDKTGTLTYGEPQLTEQIMAPGFEPKEVLMLAASLELYSKHPLGHAVLAQAEKEGIQPQEATEVSEPPGQGLRGIVAGHEVLITGRGKLASLGIRGAEHVPAVSHGLECLVVIDGQLAATFRMRDKPRTDGQSFVQHLGPKHQFHRTLIVSGDRESEVRYLAAHVGIQEVFAGQSPEQKLAIVRQETARMKTLYVGDGINDAPAMMAATIGISIGRNSDVTTEAADVIIMDNTLTRVDEFMHISRHMRQVALLSAVGGMVLSLLGMGFAAAGFLTPISGAILQEIIDVLAVLNALRAALPPRQMSDLAA